MQLLLSFVKTSPSGATTPVWTALDADQRAAVVEILARLIANAVAARSQMGAAAEPESHDE